MRKVTEKMISRFKLYDLGYDFMGYDINRPESLSFHHLIVPFRNFDGKKDKTYGYVEWNGAILVSDTSHKYLHLVEKYNYNRFLDITSEMIDQNIKGRLDPYNLRLIDMILKEFEAEYKGDIGYDGELLIKDEYVKRMSRVR